MRPIAAAMCCLFAFAPARAQEKFASAAEAKPLFLESANPVPFALDMPSDAPMAARRWPFTFDLIVGLPTGVRAQVPLSESANGAWLLEGFAGLQYVFFPEVGVGIRRRITPWSGENNAFTFSPGVGIYGLANPFSSSGGWLGGGPAGFGCVALDVDMQWRHAIGRSEEFQFGVKVGLGGFFGSEGGGVLPILGLFFGFGF